jgi:FkbM family methyltransferase
MARAVHGLLRRFGYQLTRVEQSFHKSWLDLLDLVVETRVREHPDAFFLQIGANDGVTGDPLHPLIERYGLKGLSVEPQPNAFEQLLKNRLHCPGLRFENAIVGDYNGIATLYVPAPGADLPAPLGQAASLDRAQLIAVLSAVLSKAGRRGRVEDLVTPVRLPCLTLPTLLEKHSITSVDLLVLDTMGFDYRIIKQIPLSTIAPAIIHFEHRLLPHDERIACYDLLARQGYSFCHIEMDTIAVRHARCRYATEGCDR